MSHVQAGIPLPFLYYSTIHAGCTSVSYWDGNDMHSNITDMPEKVQQNLVYTTLVTMHYMYTVT